VRRHGEYSIWPCANAWCRTYHSRRHRSKHQSQWWETNLRRVQRGYWAAVYQSAEDTTGRGVKSRSEYEQLNALASTDSLLTAIRAPATD
jgi:hypothetical protein